MVELVTLFEPNSSDIPAMLREAADNIEKGDPAIKSMVGVTVGVDGEITIYGWGATDSVDTLATLQLAIVKRSLTMLGE